MKRRIMPEPDGESSNRTGSEDGKSAPKESASRSRKQKRLYAICWRGISRTRSGNEAMAIPSTARLI